MFKEDGQEYAQVTKMLGNGRLEAMCFDGVKRLCHIRGKLRKKARITLWCNHSADNGCIFCLKSLKFTVLYIKIIIYRTVVLEF